MPKLNQKPTGSDNVIPVAKTLLLFKGYINHLTDLLSMVLPKFLVLKFRVHIEKRVTINFFKRETLRKDYLISGQGLYIR